MLSSYLIVKSTFFLSQYDSVNRLSNACVLFDCRSPPEEERRDLETAGFPTSAAASRGDGKTVRPSRHKHVLRATAETAHPSPACNSHRPW